MTKLRKSNEKEFQMRRMFVVGGFITSVMFGVHGSALAANSQELAQTSVNNIRTMQAESEQRLEALQNITQASAPSTVTGEVHAEELAEHNSESQVAPIPAQPRTDEPSFARKIDKPAAPRAFDKVKEQLKHLPNPSQRVALLQEFVVDYPVHRDARLFLARELMLNDRPSQVMIALAPLTEPGHKRSHPDWQPWFWMGSAYLSLEDVPKAREALEVALSKEQHVPDIWLHLAIAEQLDGNHAGALQYLEIAERVDPRLAQVHLNKAYSHERKGDFDAARVAYQTFLMSEGAVVTSATRPAIVRHLASLAKAF